MQRVNHKSKPWVTITMRRHASKHSFSSFFHRLRRLCCQTDCSNNVETYSNAIDSAKMQHTLFYTWHLHFQKGDCHAHLFYTFLTLSDTFNTLFLSLSETFRAVFAHVSDTCLTLCAHVFAHVSDTCSHTFRTLF